MSGLRDGVAGTFDEPPPGWEERNGRAVRIGSTEGTTMDNEPILQFFEGAYLREELREVSAPFGILARTLVAALPRNPERTVALRKLLEAKDAAVRARLYK